MVSFSADGINGLSQMREGVILLVGPNGAGKSSLLLEVARRSRADRTVTIVCNTPHDRFAGLRGVRRLSVGRRDQSPKIMVKNAVVAGLADRKDFYHINSILQHCGYRPRFGFKIDPQLRYKIDFEELLYESSFLYLQGDSVPPAIREDDDDLRRAMAFLQRHDPNELIWIDATGNLLEFSLAEEFSSVLKRERLLQKWKVIKGVTVYLEREDGVNIEMHHASSGQLALISTLLFIITNAGDLSLIVIDEPENSLHPKWQREYVEKVVAALSYRSTSIIIATHSPLVVTGALADYPNLVSTYELRGGVPFHLNVEGEKSVNSIEEILWRVFGVVTPANHFVSERIVESISRFENREIEKIEVLKLVELLDERSFDQQQKQFFVAVRALIDRVETARDGGGDEDYLGADDA